MTFTVHENKMPETPAKRLITRLIFLLDDSGSMQVMQREAQDGFNQYLQSQKEIEGEATITLITFNGTATTVLNRQEVKKAPLLETYRPGGMTALYDTIAATIIQNRDVVKSPDIETKTVLVILTDGDDTSSQFHNYATVKNLMTEVQDKDGWEVLFLGANMNAEKFATSVGIKAGKFTQFDYTSKGLGAAMRSVSVASSYARGDAETMAYVGGAAAACEDGTIDIGALYDTVSKEPDLAERLKNFKAAKAKSST